MARVRYHDFLQADSTKLFNDRFRGMLLSGVYIGYNVSLGSLSGLNLKFTHDPDPDNTGAVLGKILTPDGVIIEENANQDNVVIGSVSAGTPNIHYVVASYQYNAALPNNDVAYAVLQGISGVIPTPPVLSDNQILLAIITLPAGAVGYNSVGVSIKNVAKRDLYGDQNSALVTKNLVGVIKPGIYNGLSTDVGSAPLKVDLEPGTWVTKENFQITEAAVQSDKFTLTDPGVGQYKWAWVIGAHKFENLDPYPSPDYLIVQGTPAAIGSSAAYPTDAALQAAVFAVNGKYDTTGDSLAEMIYINKLGLIRVQKDALSNITVEYVRGESFLDQDTIVVRGATVASEFRSGDYFGAEGLERAFARANALSVLSEGKVQTPIAIDGIVKSRDVTMRVPSNVRLYGLGQKSKIISNATEPLEVEGLFAIYDGVNNLITNPGTVGSFTPPTGYVSRNFAFNTVNYPTEFTNLQDKKFARGDRILIQDFSSSITYEAIFVNQNSAFSVDLFVVTAYQTDGNPADISIQFVKSRVELENLVLEADVAGDGELVTGGCEKCKFNNLKLGSIEFNDQRDNEYGLIETTSFFWVNGGALFIDNTRNRIDHLRILDPTSGSISLGVGSEGISIGILERIADSTVNAGLTLEFTNGDIELVRTVGSGLSHVTLSASCNSKINRIIAGGSILISGGDNHIHRAETGSAAGISFLLGTRNIIIQAFPGSLGVIFTEPNNSVFFAGVISDNPQLAEHHNEDRNLKLVSDANINWNLGTATLTWDAVLRFDIPWKPGYTEIAAGNAVLADGSRLYADINRDAGGVAVVATAVRTKATASNDRFAHDRVFVAIRYGTSIYLFDGTRIEDGQNVKLGSTPPPNGSVTYQKFSTALAGTPTPNTDPLLQFNKFFRDHVVVEDNDGWGPDFLFRNTGLVTFTYTAVTGVIQFASAVDLSAAKAAFDAGVPLWLMLRETRFTGGAGLRALNKESIIAIDDAADNVSIRPGLDLTVGAGNVWNGAIGRGPAIVTNDGLVSFTYIPEGANLGRITWSTGLGFTVSMVTQDGQVFVDSAGQKFLIFDRDATGNGDWVRIIPGSRSVDTTTPTSKFHGYIQNNNNPFDLKFADMRVLAPLEFVPVDNPGHEAVNRRSNLLSVLKGGADDPKEVQRRFTTPFDERITCLVDETAFGGGPNKFPGDTGGSDQLDLGHGGAFIYEITAVCTGIVLVTNGNMDALSANGMVEIDGERVGLVTRYTADDIDNVFTTVQNRYEPLIDSVPTLSFCKFTKLPQGIHTMRIEFNDDNSAVNRNIKGFLIINDQYPQNPSVTYITDSPGTLVHKGGIRKYTDPKARVQLPVDPASWSKGGRSVRYVNKLGARTWTSRFVRSFTSTGTAANASFDLLGVTNVTNWRIGDIVLIPGPASQKFIASVSVITGTTVTLRTAWPYASGAVTIYYYGRCVNTDTYTPASAKVIYGHERPDEEVGMHLPSLNEFAGHGELIDTRAVHGVHGTPNVSVRGVRLSDCSTGFGSPVSTYLSPGTIRITTLGDIIRIGFIGTGLSLGGLFPADAILRIDGAVCGTFFTSTQFLEQNEGYFICGELPYGYHIVEIERDATNIDVHSATIYQPKKPLIPTTDMPAVELLDNNLMAASELFSPSVFNPTNGSDQIQFGTIQYGCREIARHLGDDSVLRDFPYGDQVNSVFSAVMDMGGGGDVAGDDMLFCFYGEEFSLVTSYINLVGSVAISFMGNDGVFRNASTASGAAGGFSVAGIDSLTAADNTPPAGKRYQWIFNKRSFYIVRFRFSTTGDNMDFDAIEIQPVMHNYRTKAPVTVDHWLPWQHAGIDVRPLTPFQNDQLVHVKQHTQVAKWNSAGSINGQNSRIPFSFYCHGGQVRVGADCVVQINAGTPVFSILVDGVNIDIGMLAPNNYVAGDKISLHMEMVVMLPPGMHTLAVTSSVPANTDFEDISYTAQELDTQPSRSASTKGLPVPANSQGPNDLGMF